MYEELINRLRTYTNDGTDDLRNDAADAIERLADENTRLVTTANELSKMYDKLVDEMPDGWIPVTERLPEKYHQVLVYGLNGMQIDYYAGEKSIGGCPLFMISEAKVTHWMPLPQPPKEE